MTVNLIPGNAPSGEPRDWDPESLRRRLAGVPGQDLDAASQRLIDELVHFNRSPLSRRSIVAADLLRAHVDGLMPRLSARIEGIAPPLSAPSRMQVHAIEKLLKELAIAYTRIVQFAAQSWIPFGQRKARHASLVRAIELLARRLFLCYRLYARPPRGLWASLHELYRIACQWEIESAELNAREGSAQSVYRKALLLALVDPQRLPVGDLQRARDYVARFGALAQIERPRGGTATARDTFIIETRGDRSAVAGDRLRDAVAPERHLLLHPRPLVAQARKHIEALAAGTPPAELGLAQDPDPERYARLLRRLVSAWSGETKKRAARMQFRPRAALHVGFPGVWAILDPDAAVVTGGPINEWAIVNESPAGIALRHLSGHVPPLRVGDVVGVRSRERDGVGVCLVRWIRADSADSIDVGLEQIAPRVTPVTYRPMKARGGAIVPILFAPISPQFAQVPLVVAPAKLIAPGLEFKISYLGADIDLRAERVLEATPLVELLQVSPR